MQTHNLLTLSLSFTLLATGCNGATDGGKQQQLLVGSWQGPAAAGSTAKYTFDDQGQYHYEAITTEGTFTGQGTYAWEGDRLRTEATSDDGTKVTTIQDVFVDEDHLLLAPIVASGDPDGVLGTWTRAVHQTTTLASGESQTTQYVLTWLFSADQKVTYSSDQQPLPFELQGTWAQKDDTITADFKPALDEPLELTLYATRYLTEAIFDRTK